MLQHLRNILLQYQDIGFTHTPKTMGFVASSNDVDSMSDSSYDFLSSATEPPSPNISQLFNNNKNECKKTIEPEDTKTDANLSVDPSTSSNFSEPAITAETAKETQDDDSDKLSIISNYSLSSSFSDPKFRDGVAVNTQISFKRYKPGRHATQILGTTDNSMAHCIVNEYYAMYEQIRAESREVDSLFGDDIFVLEKKCESLELQLADFQRSTNALAIQLGESERGEKEANTEIARYKGRMAKKAAGDERRREAEVLAYLSGAKTRAVVLKNEVEEQFERIKRAGEAALQEQQDDHRQQVETLKTSLEALFEKMKVEKHTALIEQRLKLERQFDADMRTFKELFEIELAHTRKLLEIIRSNHSEKFNEQGDTFDAETRTLRIIESSRIEVLEIEKRRLRSTYAAELDQLRLELDSEKSKTKEFIEQTQKDQIKKLEILEVAHKLATQESISSLHSELDASYKSQEEEMVLHYKEAWEIAKADHDARNAEFIQELKQSYEEKYEKQEDSFNANLSKALILRDSSISQEREQAKKRIADLEECLKRLETKNFNLAEEGKKLKGLLSKTHQNTGLLLRTSITAEKNLISSTLKTPQVGNVQTGSPISVPLHAGKLEHNMVLETSTPPLLSPDAVTSSPAQSPSLCPLESSFCTNEREDSHDLSRLPRSQFDLLYSLDRTIMEENPIS